MIKRAIGEIRSNLDHAVACNVVFLMGCERAARCSARREKLWLILNLEVFDCSLLQAIWRHAGPEREVVQESSCRLSIEPIPQCSIFGRTGQKYAPEGRAVSA